MFSYTLEQFFQENAQRSSGPINSIKCKNELCTAANVHLGLKYKCKDCKYTATT